MNAPVRECQRRQGSRGKGWWHCFECIQGWNERDVPGGADWRPSECPERKTKQRSIAEEAYRHRENHN